MKGLLKGFRLIHDIFDEKEQEMQIGQPTDVKHVAHIGMDGPAASKPTWMSEFNSAQELSSHALVNDLQDGDLVSGNPESLPPVEKQKKPRRKASTENGIAVESLEGGEKAEKGDKHRRHRSSNHSTELAGGDSSSHGRRHHSSRSTGGESLSNDVPLPDAPKKPRRKKTKDSDGGSSRRSKTASLPDAAEAEAEAEAELES